MHCAPCVRPVVAIPLRMTPASVIKPSTRRWRTLKLIFTSTFTWRTTSCFRVQSQWKSLTERGNHVRTGDANRTRGRPAVNADRVLLHLCITRDNTFSTAYPVHLYRPRFHVVARDFLGCVEPDSNQFPAVHADGFLGVDSGARPRPDIRLDRNFHSRDRVLLDPQASPPQFVRSVCRVHRVGALDDWRYQSMDLHCLQLALAHTL